MISSYPSQKYSFTMIAIAIIVKMSFKRGQFMMKLMTVWKMFQGSAEQLRFMEIIAYSEWDSYMLYTYTCIHILLHICRNTYHMCIYIYILLIL